MPSEKIQPFIPLTDVLKACNGAQSHFLQETNTHTKNDGFPGYDKISGIMIPYIGLHF